MLQPITEWDWSVRGEVPELSHIETFAGQVGISNLVARVLLMRGCVQPEAARGFLNDRLSSLPDPALLHGMEAAAERLACAVRRQERVLIHGDYDVDGISATALLVEFLRGLGGNVDFHIPLRLRDGYGLSCDALRHAYEQGYGLVVSVDCGISAHEPARLAKSLGLDLIITDHHQPSAELPVALALVNPHLPGDRFPDKELAGVGVAFFLAVAVRRKLRQAGYFLQSNEPDVRFLLDLVALGTIADIASLTGVNRHLVRTGLDLLNQSGRPGIVALREVAGIREITSGSVGFQLAPRLNAAGRLEDAALGVELLLSSDPRRARAIALELDGCNRERQTLEQQTLDQALEQLSHTATAGRHSIVLADERWHSGVIGIVASRLVDRFHRPTVMIALGEGQGKGSARSIRGFDLYAALCSCAGHLDGFGGHPFAAGLTIAESNLQKFREDFEAAARRALKEEDLQPRIVYDGDLDFESLRLAEVRDLSRMSPFGPGNPEPLFCIRNAEFESPRGVGRDHLQFQLRQNSHRFPCIAFGKAQHWSGIKGHVDVLCTPQINHWQGRDTLQLRVRDLKRSG